MKIRIESSSANSQKKTGVGYYTNRLIHSLELIEGAEIHSSQFDFLQKQLPLGSNVERINFPQRVYAKLDYVGVVPPFDLTLPKVDVTIFPNYALWPTINSSKSVVAVHDLTFLKYPEFTETKNLKYLKRVVPRAVRKADLILTVSETVKDELIETYNLSHERVHVTPIPPTEFYSQPSDRDIRSTYGIPTERYILFASTVEPRKNLKVLLAAYEVLPKEIRASHSLVIAGGMGWHSDAIQLELANLKNKYPNIITTGYYDQQDAAALFQQAAVFVMPSHYEGFGMPLLEAMAAKTPTIASDIPVLREVGGEATLYFPVDDPKLLAKQIITLVTNEATAAQQVTLGVHNLERYSWDIVANDLYKKLESIA